MSTYNELPEPVGIAPPVWVAGPNRGAMYLRNGPRFFAPWDFDSPASVAVQLAQKTLLAQLAEHPAMRPHLERAGATIGPRLRDGLIAFRARRGMRQREKDDFFVALYHDPELRPIFDDLGLVVEE